jgi:cell fate regulator YaaT (PSP1 superfamily)
MDMPANYKPFHVIEVKFKGSRKEFFLNNDNIYLEAGELVVVEAPTGGYDVGHVSLTGELVRMQMVKRRVKEGDVVKKIYRKATPADVDKWKAAKELEWETMHRSRTLALQLNLSMKLSDVDYQGDKTKATFYYTAEGRVDFRELIKKMAEAFRIRIEMRQIGMRQEASRLMRARTMLLDVADRFQNGIHLGCALSESFAEYAETGWTVREAEMLPEL